MKDPTSKNSVLESLNEAYFKMDELFHLLDNKKDINPELSELVYYCVCALSVNLSYVINKLNNQQHTS